MQEQVKACMLQLLAVVTIGCCNDPTMIVYTKLLCFVCDILCSLFVIAISRLCYNWLLFLSVSYANFNIGKWVMASRWGNSVNVVSMLWNVYHGAVVGMECFN